MNTDLRVPEAILEQLESEEEFLDSLLGGPTDPFPNLPATLKQIPNWIEWKLEERDGKQTKVPYVVGTNAACRYQQACRLGSLQDCYRQRAHDQHQRRSRLRN